MTLSSRAVHQILPLFGLLFLPFNASAKHVKCGVWSAKSTIPGAGFGMFAGKDFSKGEELLPSGDLVIPLVDMEIHHANAANYVFLWDEYTWNGNEMGLGLEGTMKKEVYAASPGFGAAINCFIDLTNVIEGNPIHTNIGELHRSKDPGVGGFSPYWNRKSLSSSPIKAGEELFVNYGEAWFTTRTNMGHIPLTGDLEKGNKLLMRYSSLERNLKSEVKNDILVDLWESFAWDQPWSKTSRVMFTLPRNWDETRLATNMTLTALKRLHHSVSMEWLEENGECVDWLRVSASIFPQAGRGAFGRKPFKKGETIVPLPMIHVTDRSILDMFHVATNGRIDWSKKMQTQVLENYCMGHRDSSMLLCPYGPLASHINHNQTLANAKLAWADPSRSIHNPAWLEMTVDELRSINQAGLAMNAVAIRDIAEGEEILLDYGDEWERAWQKHLETWRPGDGAKDYMTALHFTESPTRIRTVFEQISSPYPAGIGLYFSTFFAQSSHDWWDYWENGTLENYMRNNGFEHPFVQVDVLAREVDDDGNEWYRVLPLERWKDPRQSKPVHNVPLEAFRFFDQAYDVDMFQSNAFRHDIRIPDQLFPDVWKNKEQMNGKT